VTRAFGGPSGDLGTDSPDFGTREERRRVDEEGSEPHRGQDRRQATRDGSGAKPVVGEVVVSGRQDA
jgi:hypothetical protein